MGPTVRFCCTARALLQPIFTVLLLPCWVHMAALLTDLDELRAPRLCHVLQMMAYDHESKQVALKKLQKAFLEPLEVKHMTLKAFRCGLKQLCTGAGLHPQAGSITPSTAEAAPKWGE